MSGLFGATATLDANCVQRMRSRLPHRGDTLVNVLSKQQDLSLYALHRSGEPEPEQSNQNLVVGGSIGYLQLSQPGRTIWAELDLAFTNHTIGEALSSLNGAYALAVYDRASGSVYLCRDRVGSQPLYYCSWNNRFAFATEYKALLALPGVSKELNYHALSVLIETKMVPAVQTLFADIRQVPPGSYVELAGAVAKSIRYWTPELNIENDPNPDNITTDLKDLLVSSVSRRIEGESRPAVALSGGIDSMVLLASAHNANAKGIQTFTIGESADDQEIVWAKRLADYYGTDHHEVVVEPDKAFQNLAELVWCLEDPIARTESLLTFELAKLAAGKSSVMLRGDGADGLFGGMQRHKLLALAGRLRLLAADLWDVYSYTQTGQKPSRLLALMAVTLLLRQKIPPRPKVSQVSARLEIAKPPAFDREILNRVLVQGPTHALPMLLQKAERPSAYHGVDVSLPFTDNSVMEFAFALPSKLKNDGRRNKIALRLAAHTLLPEKFAKRPKFAQRITENPTFCSQLYDVGVRWKLLDAILDRKVLQPSQELISLISQSRAPSWAPEEAMLVWSLLLLEIWFRTFVDSDGGQPVNP